MRHRLEIVVCAFYEGNDCKDLRRYKMLAIRFLGRVRRSPPDLAGAQLDHGAKPWAEGMRGRPTARGAFRVHSDLGACTLESECVTDDLPQRVESMLSIVSRRIEYIAEIPTEAEVLIRRPLSFVAEKGSEAEGG